METTWKGNNKDSIIVVIADQVVRMTRTPYHVSYIPMGSLLMVEYFKSTRMIHKVNGGYFKALKLYLN